ncbi:olfactory receptor 51G2-like [Pseudophryne corroboree]|uniref:olfactory receptor 51G2-like n=1 Tax=Pseudophryne corroboree TaxID=495146 RepID=UPI0030820947
MLPLNSSHIPATFILLGFPGLEAIYGWISIPFCFMLIISFAANGLLLHVIIRDYKLHQPMYLFLSMLAITDILFLLSTCPTMLGIFLLHCQSIRSEACLLQMFALHIQVIIESSVLVAMAFDRYVAICQPLRYTSILSNSVITKVGLFSVLRGTVMHAPLVTSLLFLPYCKGNHLSYSFCLHQDLMKLACDETNTFNIMYGLAVIICSFALDLAIIILSYILIIRGVLDVTSEMEQKRLFNTCASHLLAVFFFYLSNLASSVSNRYIPMNPLFTTVVTNTLMFVCPLLNPITYSIKNKQIHDSLYQAFHKRGTMSYENRKFLSGFISLYREEECLWLTSSPDYSNKQKREAAYTRMIDIFLKLYEISLRVGPKENRKVEESKRSGAGADKVYVPQLWYYKDLHFLLEKRSATESLVVMAEFEEGSLDVEETEGAPEEDLSRTPALINTSPGEPTSPQRPTGKRKPRKTKFIEDPLLAEARS